MLLNIGFKHRIHLIYAVFAQIRNVHFEFNFIHSKKYFQNLGNPAENSIIFILLNFCFTYLRMLCSILTLELMYNTIKIKINVIKVVNV